MDLESRVATLQDMPELLTAKDLEAITQIDVKTIYAYVQKGLVPYVRIQSNIRFRKAEILDWLEKQTVRQRPASGNGPGQERRGNLSQVSLRLRKSHASPQ